MIKTRIKYYLFCGILSVLFGITSCTDYLNRDPESVISDETAFRNFNNFQGFTEEMYALIPDVAKHNWVSSFNWGEDEIITIGSGENLMGFHIDRGNYRAYINKGDCFLDRAWSSTGDRFAKSLWGGSWAGIRKANMGLEALEKGMMVDGSQAEKDIIAGQLYFFRAWFHFQLIQYWGGLPYIDYVLPSDEKLTLPRMTYKECAEKIAADFRKAADLLPINWDDTEIGRRTSGQNALRVNKIWALGFLGKNLLWAGSPLMANGVNGPRTYDADLCKRAADAFGELLNLVESGQTQYSLVSFENYSSLFYTNHQSWLMPGGTEAIMRSPTYGPDSYWRQANSYQVQAMANGDNIVLCPTANYVNYYGMANGLPLNDPESGFDPTHPWKNRDPRFYNDILYDGRKVTQSANEYQYANLYTGGNYSNDDRNKSRTGYLNYKFIPIGANTYDNDYGYSTALHIHLSWLRLADVYLMYAESAAQGYGAATGKSGKFSKTAADAINTVRDRAGIGHLNTKYTSSLEGFMGELRRERAVELSFEAHRFNDLRRWLLLTEYPYNTKTRQRFDRATQLDPAVDPKENGVKNFKEEVLVTRNLSSKHYWLPLKTDDVSLYPEFGQNPGW
ncbi:RagB/SusD family nutrient uptake outer membrane protein [Dysgonomonas gadei]|uniref:RagB/SusD domain-containing protein n=1 Tax=Dysgonomonas gadei ATCC BAA-286 TaxID=742766 RepID=F5IX77_9BACT|nr:RagB/SusD family nutrient uptake outer membrane protein [Dysgonomonas gadei]EGK02424.1 hypothetical protein HMPREF9455_01694 [Dysgonomonas gadei ATCC BAA-286]